LTRELAFTFSANGNLALSNNIPILTDEIGRLVKQIIGGGKAGHIRVFTDRQRCIEFTNRNGRWDLMLTVYGRKWNLGEKFVWRVGSIEGIDASTKILHG
jgi:hypothetical protein